MVESSFSPPAGLAFDRELPRLHRNPPSRPKRAAAAAASREFSHYVSSRTVLVGGCPAISPDAMAGRSPRPRPVRTA